MEGREGAERGIVYSMRNNKLVQIGYLCEEGIKVGKSETRGGGFCYQLLKISYV